MGRPLSIDRRIDKFLSYRLRSVNETKKYLLEKLKLPQETISEKINTLEKYGLLNDTEFADWWVDQRTRLRPRSTKAITYELLAKGVDKAIIAKSLASLELTDQDTIITMIDKKIRPLRGEIDDKIKQKLLNFLLRRGYSYSLSKKAIETAIKNK